MCTLAVEMFGRVHYLTFVPKFEEYANLPSLRELEKMIATTLGSVCWSASVAEWLQCTSYDCNIHSSNLAGDLFAPLLPY